MTVFVLYGFGQRSSYSWMRDITRAANASDQSKMIAVRGGPDWSDILRLARFTLHAPF
jgi:hypothetical protein